MADETTASTPAARRPGAVTLQGSPMTLSGPELNVGDSAPDATLVGADMKPVAPLAASAGKARLIVTVPSLDTPVCSIESKKFSRRVEELPADRVAAFVVSADLPFAQARWCGAEGVQNLTLLSDYRGLPLGGAWGLTVEEMGLLARAVYVVDADGRVVYREIVREIADEPDYDAALTAVRRAAGV